MSPSSWQNIEEAFHSALELHGAGRKEFLEQLGQDQPDLLDEVEAMLQAHEPQSALEVERLLDAGDGDDCAFGVIDSLIGMKVGSFELQELIGEGGMSRVYRGVRVGSSFKQEVAVKLLNTALTGNEMRRRFRREQQILAQLSYPLLATLIDGGVTDSGQPYLVMEYVPGIPITDYCKELKVASRLRLFVEVCEAISYIHTNLIVHRDLKPSNILVTSDGHIKLLDFGIAKLMDPDNAHHTLDSDRLLTPEHSAPEQIIGDTITTSTDVYGLGILLFQLLTGNKPFTFSSPTRLEMEKAICNTDPPRPSSIEGSDELDSELDAIVAMALEKKPSQRYNSVDQLAGDVNNFLRGQPVMARRDTSVYRLRKFVSRNRRTVTGFCLSILLLIGFTGVTVMQARRLEVERDDAHLARENTQAMVDVLTGLFQISLPGESSGSDVIPVAELLVQGSLEVERLADQPEAQIQLWDVMGGIASARGHLPQARGMYESALAAMAVGQADQLVVLKLKHQIAMTYVLGGKNNEAEPLLRESLAQYRKILGESDPDLSIVLQDLAKVAHDQMETVELLHEAMEIQRLGGDEMLGPLAASLNVLGHHHFSLKNWYISRDYFKESQELLLRINGENSPEVTVVQLNLAAVFQRLGDFENSKEMILKTLSANKRLYGARSGAMASSLNSLGVNFANQRMYAEAFNAFAEAGDIYEETSEPGRWRLALAQNNQAKALYMLGNTDQALAIMARALVTAQVDSANHASGLASLKSVHAVMLMDDGQQKKAILEIQRSLDDFKQLDPANTTSANHEAQQKFGLLLHLLGRNDEAEIVLRKAHQSNKEKDDDDSAETIASGVCLGLVLLDLGLENEGRQLLDRFQDKLKDLPLADPLLLKTLKASVQE